MPLPTQDHFTAAAQNAPGRRTLHVVGYGQNEDKAFIRIYGLTARMIALAGFDTHSDGPQYFDATMAHLCRIHEKLSPLRPVHKALPDGYADGALPLYEQAAQECLRDDLFHFASECIVYLGQITWDRLPIPKIAGHA